jgi:hypothetical protein
VAGQWYSPGIPPPIKLTATDIAEILLKMAFNTIILTLTQIKLEKWSEVSPISAL